MSAHVRMPRNVTAEHLSPAALAEISPGLSLTILADLCDVRLEHLSRMAGGKRPIGPRASAKLEAGLARARAMAEAGTLPSRKPAGAPRVGVDPWPPPIVCHFCGRAQADSNPDDLCPKHPGGYPCGPWVRRGAD